MRGCLVLLLPVVSVASLDRKPLSESENAPSQVHLALGADATSIGVSWATAQPVEQPTVEYAAVKGTGEPERVIASDTRTYNIYGGVSGYYHHAVLKGLAPATRYWYRIVGSESVFNFTSHNDSATTARLIFTGDYGMGGAKHWAGPPRDGDNTAKAWAQLAAEPVANTFFWVAGDISYANMHGKATFEATWNDWFDTLEPAFAAAPMLVTVGNHETYLPGSSGSILAGEDGAALSRDPALFTTGAVRRPPSTFPQADVEEAVAGDTSWNFTAYDRRFAMPSSASGGVRNMWYSVDVGASAHFVSIDTETDFPHAAESFLGGWGDQISWLERDLAAFRARSPSGWLVVVGHKPMYCGASGYVKDDKPVAEFANIQRVFEPLFRKYRVHLYLAGHQHGYERSAPVHDSVSTPGGTTYIVAAIPGGGCGITADWPSPRPSWNVARFPEGSPWNDRKNISEESGDLGYGILEIDADALSWKMVLATSGKVIDSVVIRQAGSERGGDDGAAAATTMPAAAASPPPHPPLRATPARPQVTTPDAPAAASAIDPGSEAAAALALRVLGLRAPSLFSFATLKDGVCASTGPCVTIEASPTPSTVILISGSTPVEMAYGLAHYCRTALNMSFSWNSTGGNVVRLPPAIPRPATPIKLQKHCAPSQGGSCYTYYANVCTLTYSMWSWSWERWQQEIDWMALNGINLVLAYTGREAVYRKVYTGLGLNQSEIGLAHGGIEAGPAFLAFSRTESWTGHDNEAPHDGRLGGPLPDSFVSDQLELNNRIVARQTELGIGSILPAFQGNVPDALRRHYPKANISEDGWLDGLDPLFAHISDLVLAQLIREFGKTGYYEADGFFDHTQAPWMKGAQRGRAASSAPLAAQPAKQDGGARAAAVYASMKRADPDAVWVYQGWVFRAMSKTDVGRRFIRSFVGAVPPTRLVLLDMEAESDEVWRATESWYNATFVWAAMDDFGGTNGLFGDVANVLNRTAAAASSAASFAGVGITMEGIDQNPPYYTLALDTIWMPPAVPRNATEALVAWGVGRCGKPLPDVARAWSLLARSVYRPGQQFTLHHIYCTETVPGGPHSCDGPACEWEWANPDMWRGTNPHVSRADLEPYFHDVYEAWVLLARSADLCDTDAARFDAVDAGREFLQIAPCAMQYSCAVHAFKQGSVANLTAAGGALQETILDIDSLLSSHSGFVLGSRLAAARALGHTDAEKDLMEWNQRSQVSLWVPYAPIGQPPHIMPNLSDPHGIAGYATKQWGGLGRSLHLPRYQLFFERAAADLASPHHELNISRYLQDVGALSVAWENERWDPSSLPDGPVGDPVAISAVLQKKYAALGTGWAECPAAS